MWTWMHGSGWWWICGALGLVFWVVVLWALITVMKRWTNGTTRR